MTHKHNERGLSLVEATIILLSLMVLTGVLAPGVRDYVNDARDVKVKEDCEAIGVSVARLLRDVGPCVRMDGRLPCVIQNRADLLISEGGEVEGYTGYAGSTFTASSSQSVSSGGGGGIVRSSYEVADDADTVSTHEVVESVTRPPAAGARWTSMTHFGGRTAFAASLTSATDLRRTFEPIGVADDVRSVLRDGGLGLASEDVVAALARPPAPAGDRLPSCAEATPPDDAVVECEIQPGTTFEWMAYRPGAATGNSKPARLLYPRWDGKSPARAAVFRVTAGDEAYTFVVPYPCANLSLLSIADLHRRTVATRSASRAGGTTVATSRSYSSARSYSTASAASYRSASAGVVYSSGNINAPIGWFSTPLYARLPYGHPNVDYLENQLVRNWPSGAAVNHYQLLTQADFLLPGPQFNLGWRGAYLSSPIGGDPWGHKYFVNTMFLFAAGGNPWAEGFTGWASNTFCLSAGRNGYVETPFASAGYQYAPGNFAWNGDANYAGGLIRGGDDFVYVISGGSR